MEILRYTAFSADPAGGNPAGVVLDATGLGADDMQSIATDVGYSETAFLVARGPGEFDVRYFSPKAEVPFCGHATIATSVAYAQRHGVGPQVWHTPAGRIDVTTATIHGAVVATLTSVEPRTADLAADDLASLLAALRWAPADLDPALRPRVAFAGVWHPVIGAGSRDRLARLDYDYDALEALMTARGWTTVDLVWRESATVWHVRNPFPPGGVVEDPATGAAAAALGGYLRELGLVDPPATLTLHQGDDMGRPGLLTVDIPLAGGIAVSGTAVAIG